ncbi:MAG: DUF11 domain-containing protein [Chloroflexota bacterium]|nr:MAG: DUF11 domain-containing protein [Chloroflexota bacterium]
MRAKIRLPILVAVVTLIASALLGAPIKSSLALPDYATKTGQSCGTCHVNPAGGGTLTAQGQAFAAIATHITDPAGAWAQVSGAAPAPTPAAPQGLQVTIEGTLDDGTATYSITLKNSSSSDVADIFIAGTVPSGTSLIGATATPAGGNFQGLQGQAAAWLFPRVPAGGSAGPFSYSVNKGSATNLAAHAWVHWLSPSDATAVSADVTPLTPAEKLINDKLNKYNANLALWRIQPGTAPRMMELTEHFNQMWFAAQAGNWTFADFEVYRVDETVKAIPVVRPAREAAMNAWWEPAQAELEAAVETQDLTAFTQAYDRAVAGCNSCHVASTGGGISLKGVKVTRPTTPLFSNLDYSGN